MAQPTTSDQPFLDYRHYLRRRYGDTLYRVPIDLGFGCPQRQADGSGGCAFCGPEAARAGHLHAGQDLAGQVAAGIRGARERYGAERYIAYFQAGTATHAPTAVLRERVAAVLAAAAFPVVVFATRPDCLPAATLDYLATLTRDHEVWVELGVQTCHDATLRRLGRGHDVARSLQAAQDLHARGITVAAHVILGLPGEGPAEFAQTAERLRAAPFAAIKIHNLHIVRGAALEEPWRQGQIATMDEHAYGEVLMTFLRQIPATWPILRLAADTAPERLLAPCWWMNKAAFRDYISRQMTQRGWRQGDLIANPAAPAAEAPADQTRRLRRTDMPWVQRQTGSRLNGLLDAVDLRLAKPERTAVVLAIGFGQGPLAMDGLDVLPGRIAPRVMIHGLTGDPGAMARMRLAYPDQAGLLSALEVSGRCRRTWGRVALHWGDPRQTVVRLSGRADLVILEPDCPELLPAVFSLDFLRRLAHVMPPGAVLVSASAAPLLRGALLRLGLAVGRTAAGGVAQDGTVAAWTSASLRLPLSERERRSALELTSGIPYRDHALNWTRQHILQYHERLTERMRRRGMPMRLAEDSAAQPTPGDATA